MGILFTVKWMDFGNDADGNSQYHCYMHVYTRVITRGRKEQDCREITNCFCGTYVDSDRFFVLEMFSSYSLSFSCSSYDLMKM